MVIVQLGLFIKSPNFPYALQVGGQKYRKMFQMFYFLIYIVVKFG
jgi:hypothetical protein